MAGKTISSTLSVTTVDTVQELPIYQWSVGKPLTPTETSVPPTGWNITPDYKWHLGGIEDDDKIVVRIPIDVKNSGASIVLKADASSEQVDYTILGKPDDNILETASSDEIISLALTDPSSLGNIVSGTSSIRRTTFFSTTGLHFICIAYVKDSSFSAYNDCGIVSVVSMDGVEINMHLWRSVGELMNGNLSGTWSEPVQASAIDGEDGLDGESAPFYTQEWYAWSNVVSTASATTSPFENQEPYSGWSTSIPNQGSDAYLWKKIVTYTWNVNTRTYVAGTPQYFRMSGTNGTSIHTRGQVANASSRGIGTATIITNSGTETITMSDGDAVTQLDDGHLYQWVTEGGGKWLDLGQFKGESGVTYYTHIAWATEVTLESSELPIPAGQTNRPNALAANISGFSITPLSGVSYAWMGYLIDANSSDSQTKQNYTWQRNKGEKGDDASEVNPNILLRTIFDRGIDFVKEQWSSDWTVTSIDAATDTIVEGRKSLRINMDNGQTGYCDLFQVIFGKLKASTWYTVSFNYFATQSWNTFLHSNVSSYPAYYDASAGIIIDGVMQTMSENNGTWQWPADWTGKRHTMTFKTASDLSGIWDNSQLLFRVHQGCQLALCMPKLEIGEVATAYMANEDDLRGEKGDEGARGKVGRFFYFGGTFNPQDNDPTHGFEVNDAQAPYFEHTVDNQKRYHVYNPTENPSGGQLTMAQMWAASNQSWNNAPWEVMTNDFKYIITEALFGKNAHLGGCIINGDWMISQYGTINGVESQNYTSFDPDHPNDNTGTNFIPNYALDMRTGATIQNSTITRFRDIDNDYTWYASGSYIVAGWSYMIGSSSNIVTNAEAKLNVPEHAGANQSIILPVDVSNVGRTITIFENSTLPLSRLRSVYIHLEERLRYGTGQFFGLCKCSISDVSKYWVSYQLCLKCGCIELVGVPIVANGQAACGWLVKSEMCGLLYDQNNHVYEGLTT